MSAINEQTIKEVEAKLPSELMGHVSKNASPVTPRRHAKDLEFLRVTWLNVLQECPKQFWVKWLSGAPQKTSKAADVGTYIHAVIEHYLKNHWWEVGNTFWLRCVDRLQRLGVDGGEIVKLGAYLERVRDTRHRIMGTPTNPHYGIELEIVFPLLQEEYIVTSLGTVKVPLIKGHIDVLEKYGDHTIVINDHKTSRTSKSLDSWKKDLQFITYAAGIRQLFPEIKRVGVRVGYVNLGYTVEWETDPADDDWLKEWFKRTWTTFVEQDSHRDDAMITATSCQGCRWCPIKKECPAASITDNHAITGDFIKRVLSTS